MFNLIGHNQQREFLKQALWNDRLGQAFIFSGEERLGKKKVAFEFVKMLFCENKEKAPCQKCQGCILVEKVAHPDFIFVSPQKREIQIDQVRELQKSLSLKPVLSEKKVVIINDAHCLNKQSQNCILKTLEEPSNQAIFILISSLSDSLLGTIKSRCETLKFYPLKDEEMKSSLKVSQDILQCSLGRPGVALDFSSSAESFLNFQRYLKITKDFLTGDLLYRLLFIKDFFPKVKEGDLKDTDKKKEECFLLLESMMFHLRRSFYLRVNDQAKESALLKTKKAIELTEQATNLLQSTNVNPRLLLENLILNF